jgi:hypothetical protein
MALKDTRNEQLVLAFEFMVHNACGGFGIENGDIHIYLLLELELGVIGYRF